MVDTYQRKICEEQADELVHKFDVQKDFPRYSMVRMPNLLEVDERVDRREERSI